MSKSLELLSEIKVFTIAPKVDERGMFTKILGSESIDNEFGDRRVRQINESITLHSGTVRGMHFQYPPKQEMKVIRCVTGSVFDVAVDIRQGSPTFLNYISYVLEPNFQNVVVIPEGFAHGFQTLTNETTLHYIHSDSYEPSLEGGLRFNDPKIDIQWPLPVRNLSKRDQEHKLIGNSFIGLRL
jgi:dTDP-4-dehydrorhamnose 3,5-epimerase